MAHADVNDTSFSSSPRTTKRLKTEHDLLDASPISLMPRPDSGLPPNAKRESTLEQVMPLLNPSHGQMEASYDNMTKEAECGITEFVSPDLFGFTGVLKKRYVAAWCYRLVS